MLTKKLAEDIVHQTMLRLRHNINVISPTGVILASGDKMRVEDIHEGAVYVAQTKNTLIINEDNIELYPNTKPGINMPIMYQDEVVGVIGITGDSEDMLEIANLVQLTTEIMTHQALVESKSEWQRKNNDYIFEALVHGSKLDTTLNKRIQKLPFSLIAPFQVILVSLHETSYLENTIPFFFEDLFYRQPILAGHSQLQEYYILLTHCQEQSRQSIIKALRKKKQKLPSLQIGIGPVVQQLSLLPYSYQGARTALEFANVHNEITFFEDVELFSLFKHRESEEVQAFHHRILKNINAKQLETLQSFFDCNLQLKLCAQQLNIHRHTLTYRLNKIRELTGYDPQYFEDAVILQVACTLRTL
ncbi:CdaR family transcriptional regulator [Lysinibacillus fusiformis]|uniref:CdaR family transcriptional regulator n=1 Tax=Lysinibacillus fusiformis TaxID=28031 RepID=UPI0035BFBE5F|nr:sugar diacid recognition domain-containing protein [Lysinibacillus fusiformis]